MNLIDVYRKVISFLNQGKFEYIVIGGMAAGIIGEPRATGDVDIDIILDKENISGFLKKAKKLVLRFLKKNAFKKQKKLALFR